MDVFLNYHDESKKALGDRSYKMAAPAVIELNRTIQNETLRLIFFNLTYFTSNLINAYVYHFNLIYALL